MTDPLSEPSDLLRRAGDAIEGFVRRQAGHPERDVDPALPELVAAEQADAHPWDGQTADIPCWVRRLAGKTFQVFAINCAHLGCPVRWFSQSRLFMCPCHGGAYYADGSRASGPPERGLFQYPYKIDGDQLVIRAGELPTLAADSGTAAARRKPCAG